MAHELLMKQKIAGLTQKRIKEIKMQENYVPLSQLGYEGQHVYALVNPMQAMERASRYLDSRSYLPITFDANRGDMPILTADGTTDPLYVVANASAQFMNSQLYPKRKTHQEHQTLANWNAISMGPSMLAYSSSGDIFVYMTEDEKESMQILTSIADSFEGIGIQVSRVFYPVSSIDEWISEMKGKVSMLPNVLDPELLMAYSQKEDKAMRALALANPAAYTKHGAQMLWEKLHVPTPHTAYFDFNYTCQNCIHDEIEEKFSPYEYVVMNRLDGSGGFATVFSERDEIESLSHPDFAHQQIQVQGVLPVKSSPCYIANIKPDGTVEKLIVSHQIFSEPGIHAGNYWEKKYDFTEDASDFEEVNMLALEALAGAGVVGQVNVDSLIVSKRNADKFGVATTTMREANIRPAGSSILNRLKQGTINGIPIEIVVTSTKIPIKKGLFFNKEIVPMIAAYATGNMHPVLYNYIPETQMASIAFTGTKDVSKEELLHMKQQTIELFQKVYD